MKKECAMSVENRLSEDGQEIYIVSLESIYTAAELQRIKTNGSFQVEITIPER